MTKRDVLIFISGALLSALFVLVTTAGGANGGTTTVIEAGLYCRSDGSCLDIARPLATATVQPSYTPTQPPSTLTPVPPTSTTTPQPTPTQEYRCWGTVNVPVLNIRTGPGTTNAILRQVSNGDTLYIEDKSGDWYQIWDQTGQGWVFGAYVTISPDAACEFGPAQIAGLHLIFSARAAPVLDALRRGAIGSIKGTDGSETIMRAARETSPHVLLIWRNLGRLVYGTRDCPANWGVGDAREVATQWWSAEYATWQARGLLSIVDYYEYRNECLYVGAWEIAFDLRMMELANNAGVCLALFSDGFGNPQVSEFMQRKPVLDYLLAHECQPGKHHVIAVHVYHGAESGDWIFWRFKLFLQALGDPKYLTIPWLWTEYGYAEGRGTADCTRFIADIRQAVRYLAGSQVWSVAAYSVGGGTEWVDLDGCLPLMTN